MVYSLEKKIVLRNIAVTETEKDLDIVNKKKRTVVNIIYDIFVISSSAFFFLLPTDHFENTRIKAKSRAYPSI